MSDFAIRVKDLCKCHQIYEKPSDRLKQFVVPRFQRMMGLTPRQYFLDFWALRDVSFDLHKGESLAIIGRNGAGKSTLLQMICGTLSPTTGSVETNGRVAALLELGAGFNFEFSGRENIYISGAILGLSADEIDGRIEDILGFADIGDFIDQPVKTYSSGMFVRLAFGIQVNVSPEILIVDEALSVGDYFFQQKCFSRLRKMREDGLTLLFVSHDMGTVRDLCPNAVFLVKGKAAFVGNSQEAIRIYLSKGNVQSADVQKIVSVKGEEEKGKLQPSLAKAVEFAVWRKTPGDLGGCNRLLAVVVKDEDGNVTTSVRMGRKLSFEVYFRTLQGEKGHISISIKNKYNQVVVCTGSYFLKNEPLSIDGGYFGVFNFEIDFMLEAGLYSFSIGFGMATALNVGESLDQTDWLGPLRVDWNYENDRAPFLGQFGLPVKSNFMVPFL